MRVLFTSGYLDDTVERRGIFTTGSGFLPKPYAATVLLRRVREILDGPAAGPPNQTRGDPAKRHPDA